MSDQQATDFELEQLSRNVENNVSGRSRASSVVSSVISTGTKFSVSTLPQANHHIEGVLDGSGSGNQDLRPAPATRPASLFSVSSTATSLPPYEGHQPLDPSHMSVTQDGQIVGVQGSLHGSNNAEQRPTLSSDSENALSRHYGNVVRTIDANHQRLLARTIQGHTRELAATRETIDKAYRKEFKAMDREMERVREQAAADVAALEEARDCEVEKLRKEAVANDAAIKTQFHLVIAAQEETMAKMRREAVQQGEIMRVAHEKSCNAIEDVWEGRWNDRMKLAAEEVQRHVSKRDEEWVSTIRCKYPELVDEMRAAMRLAGQ